MKRCPTCDRVETDDALAFCRADGTALVNDSPSLDREAGMAQHGSVPTASETATSILPQTTDAAMSRATVQTTVLPAQPAASTTRELTQPKRPKVVILLILFFAIVAAAIVISGYLYYYSRKSSTAIESIAVLPFENRSGSPDTDYLSDGLAESLIYRLSQLPNLMVSPTSSVFRYKGKEVDAQMIAGYAYAKSGRRDAAKNVIAKYKDLAETQYVSSYNIACLYAALGDKEKAFAELGRAFAEHAWDLHRLKVDPFMDPLRDDPRFANLVKRIGLGQ